MQMNDEQIEMAVRDWVEKHPDRVTDINICLLFKNRGEIVPMNQIRKILVDLYMSGYLDALYYDERKEQYTFRKDLTVKRGKRTSSYAVS
jgi:hypothetical protein